MFIHLSLFISILTSKPTYDTVSVVHFLFQPKVIILLLFHVQSFYSCWCFCCCVYVYVCKPALLFPLVPSFKQCRDFVCWFISPSPSSSLSVFHLLFKLAKLNVFVVRLLDRRTFFTSGLSVRVSSCCSGCFFLLLFFLYLITSTHTHNRSLRINTCYIN